MKDERLRTTEVRSLLKVTERRRTTDHEYLMMESGCYARLMYSEYVVISWVRVD